MIGDADHNQSEYFQWFRHTPMLSICTFRYHQQALHRCRGLVGKSFANCADTPAMTTRTKDLANTILLSDAVDKGSILQRRLALSRAITLIESQSPKHVEQANLLLNHVTRFKRIRGGGGGVIPGDNKRSFRVGIAGAPGAGKSSFIESFGKFVLDELPLQRKHAEEKSIDLDKLAVVCIDPSSSITGGSILGDKTRMMDLSRHQKAFVRPSPTRGVLGGLSSYTNDVVTLCEAAGYDLVLVETVGLGQSEIDISQTVDMLVLVVSPGGGDGLQGAKKGILELSDMIIVNKADGSLLTAARTTAADYKGATHFFRSRMDGWETPPVLLASAETGEGIPEVWGELLRYKEVVTTSGVLQSRRSQQARYWLWKHIQEQITHKIRSDESIRLMADELEHDLEQGLIAPRAAASKLLDLSTHNST